MSDFSVSLKDTAFPGSVDFALSGDEGVGSFALPEVVLPFALIYLSCGLVVVGAVAVAEVVLEGTDIGIAVRVEESALEWGGGVEVGAFETLTAGEEQWGCLWQQGVHY
jgi:hypothetical protein